MDSNQRLQSEQYKSIIVMNSSGIDTSLNQSNSALYGLPTVQSVDTSLNKTRDDNSRVLQEPGHCENAPIQKSSIRETPSIFVPEIT